MTDLATSKRDATTVGKAWLALVDAERYGESWDQAATIFKDKVARDQWTAMARGVRSGLGKLKQRTFQSSSFTEAEGGQFVVLLWSSSFASMPTATEQVTMAFDDGAWRCAGYFVPPRCVSAHG